MIRVFVILSILLAAVLARPDIGYRRPRQGYNYQNPGSSSRLGPNGGYNGGGRSFDGATSEGSRSSGGKTFVKPVYKLGEPKLTKHFYIFEAPDEPENTRNQEKEIIVKPKIHYKIIFIKTPTSGNAFGGSNVPIFPQREEKTIVYVLSKKSDGLTENGEFPTPPPPVTSKPEVFFVKYKTKQEADQAVSKIQESFQEGGPGYNSPASFVKSLGASSAGASVKSFSQQQHK